MTAYVDMLRGNDAIERKAVTARYNRRGILLVPDIDFIGVLFWGFRIGFTAWLGFLRAILVVIVNCGWCALCHFGIMG